MNEPTVPAPGLQTPPSAVLPLAAPENAAAVGTQGQYRPLPPVLSLDGLEARQIWRGETAAGRPVAVYERGPCRNPEVARYDVFYIRRQKARTVTFPDRPPADFPAREVYPPAESWGTEGWTLIGQAAAMERARKLCG